MDNGSQRIAKLRREFPDACTVNVEGDVDVNIGVPTETATDEERVALIPPIAADLVEDGHEVYVAAGAGKGTGWANEDYEDAGCTVLDDREAVFEQATIVFQVQALGAAPDAEMGPYQEGQIVVGMLDPYAITDDQLTELADRNVSAFSMELIPRISRAQSMDALSSQASLAGYQACLIAAEELPKM
ncbi:MAG: hypothetical protein V5A27_06875, partial [Halapricum sp.]